MTEQLTRLCDCGACRVPLTGQVYAADNHGVRGAYCSPACARHAGGELAIAKRAHRMIEEDRPMANTRADRGDWGEVDVDDLTCKSCGRPFAEHAGHPLRCPEPPPTDRPADACWDPTRAGDH